MPDINEKLERFRQVILQDAQKERDAVLKKVEQTRSDRLTQAETEIRLEIDAKTQTREDAIRAETGRQVSRRMLENQRTIASRRDEMSRELFAAVREKLLNFTRTEDYLPHLKKLYREAFAALGNPFDGVIWLRPADMQYSRELATVLPGRHVTFQEGSFILGGLIVDCHSRMLRADQTYDTALGDLDGHFAELFGLSLTDDGVLEGLLFDVRLQVALHTTSFEEQPLSDKSLQRFRRRCLEWETRTGEDLVRKCVVQLADRLAGMSGIDGSLKRMDSMMIASNIRDMSRLELLYVCVADVVKSIRDEAVPELLRGMEHYLDEADRNRVIYHNKEDKWEKKVSAVLGDAERLLRDVPDGLRGEAYARLERAMREQAVKDEGTGHARLREKKDGAVPGTMQNPHDEEATYRSKAGKGHIGYTGNLVESVRVDEDGKCSASIIVDYDVQPNTYSDVQFLKDAIEKADPCEQETVVVADGAYADEELRDEAAKKKIRVVNTNLTGKDANPWHAAIQLSDDKESIVSCPAGKAPLACSHSEKTGRIRATMEKAACEKCPFRYNCGVSIRKTKAILATTWKSVSRSKQQGDRYTKQFQELARIRNGVEALPSLLRRSCHIDRMPVRGRLRMKQRMGFKVAAANIRKNRQWIRREKCAQNQATAA